jgi:hypothetical protein
MPGLRGNAGGDDADIGARDIGVILRALQRHIGARDGRAFGDVERLALGRALGDVEQTTSPSSFSAARWASVPPICPAPISAILFLAMPLPVPISDRQKA